MTDALRTGDLYVGVRRAVRDALWDDIGAQLSLLIAIVLFGLGVQLLAVTVPVGLSPTALAGTGVGLVLVGLAAYEIYRTFYR